MALTPDDMSDALFDRLDSDFSDDGELEELIQVFIEELDGRMAALRDAWDAGDRDRVASEVHRLKGTGVGYGYPDITMAAAELESALANEDNLGRLVEQYQGLLSLCKRASG